MSRSNNPSGRPKGSRNKKPKVQRTAISEFVETEFHKAVGEFHELPLKDRFLMLSRFMPFTVPKYHTVDRLAEMKEERMRQEEHDRTLNNILKKIMTDEQKKQLEIEYLQALQLRAQRENRQGY